MSGFGTARELKGDSALTAVDSLCIRNETLSDLFSSPDVAIFAIQIDRYQWVEGYARVLIYEPV